jgi:tetratricopeptide (TPR) repeat protein
MTRFQRDIAGWLVFTAVLLLLAAGLIRYAQSILGEIELGEQMPVAQLAMQRGDVDAAITGFTRIVRFNPEAAPPRLELAAIYQDLGRNRAALDEARIAARYATGENLQSAHLAHGRAALVLARFAEAAEAYRAALATDSACGEAYDGLAQCAEATGDFAAMAEALTKLAETGDTRASDAFRDTWRARRQVLSRAQNAVDRAGPNGPRLYRLAMAQKAVGRWNEALTILENATGFPDVPADAHFWYAVGRQLSGATEQACDAFGAVVQIMPRHAAARQQLAQCAEARPS